MMELALRREDGPVPLEVLATSQDIPLRYLAKIAQDLKRAGLVRSVRGAHGGYMLARDPAEVEIIDIVQALDGGMELAECVEDPRVCRRVAQCVTRELWRKAQDAMKAVLSAATLEELAERQRSRKRNKRD